MKDEKRMIIKRKQEKKGERSENQEERQTKREGKREKDRKTTKTIIISKRKIMEENNDRKIMTEREKTGGPNKGEGKNKQSG